jgi:hypothetical protein
MIFKLLQGKGAPLFFIYQHLEISQFAARLGGKETFRPLMCLSETFCPHEFPIAEEIIDSVARRMPSHGSSLPLKNYSLHTTNPHVHRPQGTNTSVRIQAHWRNNHSKPSLARMYCLLFDIFSLLSTSSKYPLKLQNSILVFQIRAVPRYHTEA